MVRMNLVGLLLPVLLGVTIVVPKRLHGQQEASARSVPKDRPPLFFREDWKETPAAMPITQDHVANPSLILSLYGPGKDHMRKSHHDKPADDPFYIWGGLSTGNWAVSLRHRDSFVNLTGTSKFRWRTMQTGLRQLHVILKLADGNWLVSDQAVGNTSDWQESEFSFADLHWHTLDINRHRATSSRQARSKQSGRDWLDRFDDKRRHACQFSRGLARSLWLAGQTVIRLKTKPRLELHDASGQCGLRLAEQRIAGSPVGADDVSIKRRTAVVQIDQIRLVEDIE